MPRVQLVRSTAVIRSPRVVQLEGMFDVSPTTKSEVSWDVNLPLEEHDWNVGLIVGPSGCGKSTIARELFPDELIDGFRWPKGKSIVDAFPKAMGMKQITRLLSSVGFSSVPSWLRPFGVLSNGEQFRVTIARALAEKPQLAVIDEFTSVVDRTVAQIGSAAIAKTVRRLGNKFIGVACHYDILDWMAPDWVYEPATDTFHWRCLQQRERPPIDLTIRRVYPSAWKIFKHHHYLDTNLSHSAACFVGFVDEQPAAFCSVLPQPARNWWWREHRTVCLPDFQGVGIGNAISAFVGSLFAATGRQFRSTTSNPAMIQHCLRSPLWKMHRRPTFYRNPMQAHAGKPELKAKAATRRLTAGFTYIGPTRPREARAFGVLKS